MTINVFDTLLVTRSYNTGAHLYCITPAYKLNSRLKLTSRAKDVNIKSLKQTVLEMIDMVTLPVYGKDNTYTVNPSKIIALGLNYREHIAEHNSLHVQGFTAEIPDEPVLFPKTPNVLIGPGEPIVIPRFLKDYNFDSVRVDYEAELAFIIKDRCKNVSADDALNHILGFTCMNDVSQRNIQRSDKSGWFRGKSLDTFGPIGPRIVPTEYIDAPQNLNITCRVNGKTVQSSNTGKMIFSVKEILAFISKNFTLMPGDLILTGTPSGVGPIKHGDVVEVEIEKIGILKNPVLDEGL